MGCIRTGSDWRWLSGVIPYRIDDSDFPSDTVQGQTERQAIMAAVNYWNDHTLLKFRPRQEHDLAGIKFVAATEEGACSSHVGRDQFHATQEIPCNPPGGALVHEMGHAVGLWHEQQREDRDLHITVHLDNVRSDKRSNFNRHVDDGTDIGTYDFDSVMHYRPGGFAVDWYSGTKLPDQRSTHAPAVVSTGAELHVVHLGNGSKDLWHSWTTNGVTWTANAPIPVQRSQTSPALAVFGTSLHMIHLGTTTSDIWHSISTDRRTWSPDKQIGLGSRVVPALVTFKGALHMVHLGSNSNDLWHSWSADEGAHWRQRPIPDQRSRATPALAVFDSALHMLHLGDSHDDLWHSWTSDGRNWTANTKVEDQGSSSAPSLAVFDSQLHASHTGTSSGQIWHTIFDGSTWLPNNRNDNNRSQGCPNLVPHQGKLHMVYRGDSDHNIWHSVRDTSIVTFDTITGTVTGTGGRLSDGDLAAVKVMYPAPPPNDNEWLQPTLHLLMAGP